MRPIPHFLVIPFPVLGHVNPLMQFSQVLAEHGCKVTFLNTEFSQKRAMAACSSSDQQQQNNNKNPINIVTLPDGLGEENDRSKPIEFVQSVRTTMPEKLPKLIEDVNNNGNEDSKISCIVVSMNMGWALEVGHKLGIKGAVMFPSSATSVASLHCVQRLIHDGIIDSETGLPTKNEKIQLCPDMPMMDPANLPWTTLGKSFFRPMLQEAQTLLSLGQWWLCNTTYELEPGALSISPKILPIGPLLPNDQNNTTSSFWKEDQTCLGWLDQQPPRSVVYVSFGSLAVMDPNQFKELALGLDLLDRPFLWVVRPSNTNKRNNNYTLPDGFNGEKGKIVNWAPQRKVLNHPSVACFVSHCGWNSTIDGVYSGVPFLCWPFFGDQFEDKAYVCDEWKIGMGLDKDENSGLILREEIKKTVDKLLGDEEIRENSFKWKEIAMNNIIEHGRSSDNLKMFIDWAKEE